MGIELGGEQSPQISLDKIGALFYNAIKEGRFMQMFTEMIANNIERIATEGICFIITACSFIGTQLVIKRKRMGFWLWIVTDVAFIVFYATQHIYVQSAVMFVYLGQSIYGLYQWYRIAKRKKKRGRPKKSGFKKSLDKIKKFLYNGDNKGATKCGLSKKSLKTKDFT